MKKLRSAVLAFVLVVLVALSVLFTYGPRYSESIPSWQDIYEKLGLVEEEEKTGVYESDFTVSFLDVGQGSSALLHSNTSDFTMLIDTGEQGHDQDITDEMRKVGAKKLDYVILTHPHSDHVGSFPELVKTVNIGTVIIPDIDRSKLDEDLGVYDLMMGSIRVSGANQMTAKPGTTVPVSDDITITLLGPVTDTSAQPDNLNNVSVFVRVQYGDVSFLFTGDGESEEELDVLNWVNEHPDDVTLSSTVLAAGHHGSYTSSNRRFVAAVRPKAVVISCGKDNDYGHPHDSTLRTFKDIGAKIYRTDQQGTIVLGTDGSKLIR